VPHLLWHGVSVFPVSSEGPSHSVASYDTQGGVEDRILKIYHIYKFREQSVINKKSTMKKHEILITRWPRKKLIHRSTFHGICVHPMPHSIW
jgi:hypothetical protein